MAVEVSWMNKILKHVKNECNKVRSIQHILSRKNHASLVQQRNVDTTNTVRSKFGTQFTDHMLKMEFDSNRGGWQEAEITRFENLSLHPAAKVLQYATTLFEGMKAYQGDDKKIRLFRPLLNLQRLNKSAERICLPQVNSHFLLRSIEKLLSIDAHFVPDPNEGSLYIRPTIIGTDPILGINAPSKALLYVILCPCGSYFDTGLKPIRLYADPNYVRAWIGGAGNTKIGSNYGPTIYVQKLAERLACQQAMWLYGADEQITEAGTMTVFAHYINDEGEHELLTPPLDGLILPGVTRQSILELARQWNEFNVVEKRFTMAELIRLRNEKRLLELFGAGTACLVCPISEILYRGQIIRIPTTTQANPLYSRFFKTLTSIYHGRVSHPWAHEVEIPSESTIENNYRIQAAI